MKTTMLIEVRGKDHLWSFPFEADPKHLDAWRADGLEVFEVLNSIPDWAVSLGLTRVWFGVQDVWRWMRLF